jgi:hypothetical protein
MCVTELDIETVRGIVRRESLERNRLLPEPWPICSECGGPIPPDDLEEIYPFEHSTCGINHLERLFFEIASACSRKKQRAALRRLGRYARTGR